MKHKPDRNIPPIAPRPRLAPLLFLLACLAASAAVPMATADAGFGSQVLPTDPDHIPSTKKASSLFTIKQGHLGDAMMAADDCLLLEPKAGGSAAAVAKDVRLVPCLGKEAGSQFKQGDEVEAAATWTVVGSANLQYADVNVNQKYDRGDQVYLTTGAAPGLAATSGPGEWTVRITAATNRAAGTFVFAGEDDFTAYAPHTRALAFEVVERDDKVWFFVPAGLAKSSLVPLDSIRFSGSLPAPKATPEAAADSGPPDLAVLGITVPESVTPGAPIPVQVEVQNVDEVAGSGLVEVRFGDRVVDARGTPTLRPGEAVTLVVTLWAEPGAEAAVVRAGDAEAVVALDVRPTRLSPAASGAAGEVGEAGGSALPAVLGAGLCLAGLIVLRGGRRHER